MTAGAVDRVTALLRSAARIARADDPLGRRARESLPASTGLSPAGVELALLRCFETAASAREIEELCRSTRPAARAHVLLSANVFTAALRAVAIGLAASPLVQVRASRREPYMPELLLEACPGAFELVRELSPRAGDQLWAYGSDTTLQALRQNLADGVVLHAHGPGFGVVAVERGAMFDAAAATELATDLALFDQRGCLSPRLLVTEGDEHDAIAIGRLLAGALIELERRVPLGRLAAAERAELSRYESTLTYAGTLLRAGSGVIGVGDLATLGMIAPVGRNLHVAVVPDARGALDGLAAQITTVACLGSADFRRELQQRLPGARVCSPGRMQSPPLDGPADRRVRLQT
jgi:hypothetical protein